MNIKIAFVMMMKKTRWTRSEEGHEDKRGKTELASSKEEALIERCGQKLFVLEETLDCAVNGKCIACIHKICAGEELLPGSKPNVRPESCLRAHSDRTTKDDDSVIGLYPKGSRILTVGDGDLSFSLALVRVLGSSNVIATTYESRASILASYPDTGAGNISELEELKCTIMHGVDAGNLEASFSILTDRFDFIVFNFPCIATAKAGEDGQTAEIVENQALLSRFGCGASKLLNPSGFVHISHKTKAAFKNWGVTKYVCETSELTPAGAVVFDRCVYPRYINRKARDRKSFPVSDAVTFLFSFDGRPERSEQQRLISLTSTLMESIKVLLIDR